MDKTSAKIADTQPDNSESKTQLYRHFDKSGKLLYVGISLSAVTRLAQHRATAEWFSEIRRVEIEHYDTRAEAMEAERAAIQAESPEYNVIHVLKQQDQPLGDEIPTLDAPALKAALEAISLTPKGLALLLGVHHSIVYRWLSGETPVPRYVEIIVGAAVEIAEVREWLGI